VYAQLGQQPLVRTTETSLELNPLSCLSARPPDLAPGGLFTILYYIFEYEEDRLYVYLWVPTSVGSRRLRHQLAWRREGGSVRA